MPGQVEHQITAAEAVASFHEYSSLRLFRRRVYGVRYDAESGKNQLCRFEHGHVSSLLPEEFSVRSRVHEYGGGAWCQGHDHAYFINDTDQQLWVASLSGQAPPRKLTAFSNTRMGDLQYDQRRQRLILVCETRDGQVGEPVNYLGAVTAEGRLSVLTDGADFYSSPTLSPDGKQLAWIEWDHPFQPWDRTRVKLADVSDKGRLHNIRQVSDIDAAWGQPRFAPDGVLHVVVDRTDWWSIEQLTAEGFKPLPGTPPAATEFTTAPWQFGLNSYSWDRDGHLLAIGQSGGYSRLYFHDGQSWQRLYIDQPASRLHSLVVVDDLCFCAADFSNRLPAILHLTVDTVSETAASATVAGGETPEYSVAVPEPRATRAGASTSVPYFLYRPVADSDHPRPLIVYSHGGPTAMTAPSFRPAIQYWIQRGFMIADVNYRGSTGFGRNYRMQLAGQWGLTDVEDVEAVARELVDEGLANADALFIRGNSAGGFTTLCALANSTLFTAGASLYGVADPARLCQLTHKFESRYLHWLIGDPAQDSRVYQQRSPLGNADRIQAPVIFFQGMRDAVVLPEQTRQMAESLKRRGIEVESRYFDDEAHGFRIAANQIAVLEGELSFYRRQLNRLEDQ